MNSFIKFLKGHWVILLFSIGGLVFDVWAALADNPKPWLKICGQIGELFAVGGVFSFLLTYEGFTSAFQDALQRVIYTPDFLKHRDDLSDIWAMVSKEVFKRKFKAIQVPLLDIVTREYFPTSDINCYYNNLKQIYKISIVNKEAGIVSVEEFRTLTLMADSTNELSYKMTNRTKMKNPDDKIEEYFTHILLNVDDKEIHEKPSRTIDGEDGVMTYNIKLKDKTSYKITQKFSHLQDLDDDNFICFRAMYLIQNMDVEIKYDPNDIIVDFYPNGTINLFENILDDSGHKRYNYEGLILSKQGYVIALRIKK